MTSSESESQPRSRKRSKTSATGEETGGKKARGRPRVDTQDATAADRRRTQIRLAQRAYRQRKETTISSLKGQNDRLQSIIEQMNKSFLRFNDSALKSGMLQLNSNLAHELRHVTETFVALAKSASEGHDGDEDLEPDIGDGAFDQASEFHKAATATRASQQSRPSQTSRPPVAQHVEVGWGYSASFAPTSPSPNEPSPQQTEQAIYNNYLPAIPNKAYESTSRETQIVRTRPRQFAGGESLDQSRPQSFEFNAPLPFGMLDLDAQEQSQAFRPPSHTFTVNIPTPDVTPPSTRLSTPPILPSISTKSLKPSWTYSHDETTFSRRLTRASLEAGFHILSSANTRPAALNYVFRLSLPYMTLDALRERFRMLLARGTDEELDFWETPYIHLGGAGTHYPRKDKNGNIVPLPNSWTVRSIGPVHKKLVKAENTQDPTQSHSLSIDLAAFEGSEWFDSTDVEGYLEDKKGCHINPKDSFTEVLIDDDRDSNGEDISTHPFKNLNMDMNLSTAHPSSPELSYGSSSTESSSNDTTPTHHIDPFGQETFGLDMGMTNLNDSFKFPDIDVADFFDQPLGLDLAPGFGSSMNHQFSNDSFGGSGSGATLDLMGEGSDLIPVIRQKKKKTAWVDVAKMVDELVKHGICLGRAPGFRKEDVEAAFQASLVHAF
ncbi:hypothetical protein B0J11DRAFT_422362 [Dendryphion nanum]|uniref:BZIP domain-containing protein n=1 Tax=Dendryphion nanum TaxID=256645 RepID=A0A9P9EIN9_9PLEO|nr:hypothetical protein B0J11DRAFT_422362 [Dendryphion nanum]